MIDLTATLGTHIITTVKEFIVLEQCPITWRGMDLYLLRDDVRVFYIGQSSLAYNRIWQHFIDGYKGRSTIGRFISCNWRASMYFIIELFSSMMPYFQKFRNNPNEIERYLIELTCPCFNIAMNKHPTVLPENYIHPDQPIKNIPGLKKMIREAGYFLKAERRKSWV